MSFFRNYKIRNYNFRLVVAVLALTILGIFVVGSANESYMSKQIMGMLLGLMVMTVVSFINYSVILNFHWAFWGVACVMLGLVFTPLGYSSHNATRWLSIGSFRYQPSEFAKLLIVLFFARYLMDHEEDLNSIKRLALCALFGGIPLLLIVREPDLSTTIVTFMMIFAMMFFAGLTYKIVAPFVGIGIFGVLFIIYSTLYNAGGGLLAYQSNRIKAWLQPEKYPDLARQQQNSIMAIGSGQLFGKGLNNTGVDSVKNGNYIPEPHTDFIFAVAGEELGFFGATIIIILIFIIVYECYRTAKRAKDLGGKLICIGMGSLVGFQSFVNICVVTGLMPNTGLPLPFLSYGLTSLVTLYFGVGLVLNVSLQSKKFYEV